MPFTERALQQTISRQNEDLNSITIQYHELKQQQQQQQQVKVDADEFISTISNLRIQV
jgi:hypothetical protein